MAIKFLRTGAESAKLAQQDAVETEQRRAEQGKMWRFWLSDGEDARITFVDGELGPDGVLTPPRFYEHTIEVAGQKARQNFVCPEKTNPDSGEKCPLCEQGDRPSLVALFTVIDHRQGKRRDGTVYKDTVKILAAKPTTFEMLNKLAIKRGGLAGSTFDVSRSGDKSAAVGSNFDHIEKHTVEELQKKYIRDVKDPKSGKISKEMFFKPANYEEEIVYRDEDTLRQMGFGKGVTTGKAPVKASAAKPSGDLPSDEELEDYL